MGATRISLLVSAAILPLASVNAYLELSGKGVTNARTVGFLNLMKVALNAILVVMICLILLTNLT